jgi:aryl-alcohol dehydrogenase-like predicted oxidoreductase
MLEPGDIERIWFGCGNFGGIGSSPHLRSAGDREDVALTLLNQARACGLKRFDTANTYGGGASESVLGKWLRSQDKAFRHTIEVATKVGNPHGCPPGEAPLSAAQIAHHLDISLIRLGVDRVDLYYIHEFDHATPLDETLEAMTRALKDGKIDRFGISNATLGDVEDVRRLAGEALARRFAYVQNEYNLLSTSDAGSLIPYCAQNSLRYTAFSPLAGGFLTGKYRPGEPPPAASRYAQAPDFGAAYATEQSFLLMERLRRSADLRKISLAEAALRFVLDTPGIDSLIIAPRRREHFQGLGLSRR